MPNRCRVVNCNGNYNDSNKCRVFRLPKDEVERQRWIDVLPPRKNFVINPSTFFICEKHWPKNASMVTLPGGHTKPVDPPSIFDVPASCLPTPKAKPRQPKVEDKQLDHFLQKDKITSFANFSPDKQLLKKYKNLLISRSEDTLVCVFMTEQYKESYISITVHNKPTLCSPLTLIAYKNGLNVPLGKILNPNNGLASYSQFFAAVNAVFNHNHTVDNTVEKVVNILQTLIDDEADLNIDKSKKLKFLTRQLHLLCHKTFSMSDYCFAIESFPHCKYEQLRDVLVLPSKRKVQSIVSATGVEQVLDKTFQKTTAKQKYSFLIVDEVKIRPTVAFSSGVLNGFAKNNPDLKATSMLCVMLKCLHGGPSIMVSATPVAKLTAAYQFSVVQEVAAQVEKCGGIVIGSITDNHKINQQYCKLFHRISDSKAQHPLDSKRPWFLLYDTVHLLKCIRNNWITEKCQKISLDSQNVASFSDVKSLYLLEKENILKTTPLTHSSVFPSKLQLQNVKHVLKVFNEKVVGGLKLQGSTETADFVQCVLHWWKIVNVCRKGEDSRFRDPARAVQTPNSDSLHSLLEMFQSAQSGHGERRIQCFTHDTKRALVQTTEGMIAICQFLFSVGFEYVLLRELQSDRIEGEFSVYRQSTGANAFMAVNDVYNSFKKRLARYAATFLQSLEMTTTEDLSRCCDGIVDVEDAALIENSLVDMSLTNTEESAVAYVAGWLEKKCQDEVVFTEEEVVLMEEAKSFIEEVSRGYLTVPHTSTYELVRAGLCFIKKNKEKVCCRRKFVAILSLIDSYCDLGLASKNLSRRLANVLLHGIHNLEKDQEKNAVLYQTSLKKARLSD